MAKRHLVIGIRAGITILFLLMVNMYLQTVFEDFKVKDSYIDIVYKSVTAIDTHSSTQPDLDMITNGIAESCLGAVELPTGQRLCLYNN